MQDTKDSILVVVHKGLTPAYLASSQDFLGSAFAALYFDVFIIREVLVGRGSIIRGKLKPSAHSVSDLAFMDFEKK